METVRIKIEGKEVPVGNLYPLEAVRNWDYSFTTPYIAASDFRAPLRFHTRGAAEHYVKIVGETAYPHA